MLIRSLPLAATADTTTSGRSAARAPTVNVNSSQNGACGTTQSVVSIGLMPRNGPPLHDTLGCVAETVPLDGESARDGSMAVRLSRAMRARALTSNERRTL